MSEPITIADIATSLHAMARAGTIDHGNGCETVTSEGMLARYVASALHIIDARLRALETHVAHVLLHGDAPNKREPMPEAARLRAIETAARALVDALPRREGHMKIGVSIFVLADGLHIWSNVTCTEGAAFVDYMAQTLTVTRRGGARVEVEVAHAEPLALQLDAFARLVESGEMGALCSGADGAAVVAMAERAAAMGTRRYV